LDADLREAHFPPAAITPASARAFLRATLDTWTLDGYSDIAELLTDELVGNVVRHVRAPMSVRVLRGPSSIRVEVEDASTAPPILQQPAPWASTGRGIMLIDALSNRWGADIHNAGKTVWFELDVDSRTTGQ
jgi:hypothetical protein